MPQLALHLPRHQQIAELAVLVGPLGIEQTAIEHRRAGALAQTGQLTQPSRFPHLAAGCGGVMHLRAGDHQPRRGAPQQQGEQALQQGLVGKVVHGDRELKTLHRPARFAGAAVLQAGVEHQAVDRLPSRQQVCCAALDAGEIAQVADRRRQPAP